MSSFKRLERKQKIWSNTFRIRILLRRSYFYWNWNDKYVHTRVVPSKIKPDSRPKWAKCIPLFRSNGPKTLPDGAARATYMACSGKYPSSPPREARDCDRDSMRPLLQLSYLLTGDSAGTVGREYLRGRALGQSKKRATVCSVLSLLSAGHSHRGNILHIITTRIFLLSILFLIDYTTEGIKVVLLGLPLRESRKAFWFPTMGSFVLSLCTDAPLP